MILPIVAYGHPTLKAVAQDITPDYPELEKLLSDMWETLAHSEGVGLAAPQVNKSIRLFIVDGNPFYPDYPDGKDFKQVFINAELLETFGDDVPFKEGCLSVPNIYEEVMRPDGIRIKYLDENFVEHVEEFTGIRARIIQHEYDHLEGHVHVDRIAPLRKVLLQSKLRDISEGKCDVDYRMIFPRKKKQHR
ncbi:MAG: peptide deformylase [Bacteroidales bacterium]|nr:peptide deformylase [Bacteroidales bacterium]